jgi:hypothetical protein
MREKVAREAAEHLAELYRQTLQSAVSDERMMWKASGVHDALVALGYRDIAEDVIRPYVESGRFKVVSATEAGQPPPPGGWTEEFFRRLLSRDP